jgi:hypothetical protein
MERNSEFSLHSWRAAHYRVLCDLLGFRLVSYPNSLITYVVNSILYAELRACQI